MERKAWSATLKAARGVRGAPVGRHRRDVCLRPVAFISPKSFTGRQEILIFVENVYSTKL